MNKTSIGWCDYSSNPIKFRSADGRVVWACEKVSPGCTHCYAEHLSTRYGGVRRAGDWNAGTMAGLTPFLDEKELRAMLTYKPISGKRVFVGDMTDVFGAWVPDALLDRLFAVFALRSDVTWQVLTKRAQRLHDYFADDTTEERIELQLWEMHTDDTTNALPIGPLKNVWLGVSCEDQHRADERIPLLMHTPAAVRFVSAEPLLGPVDLWEHLIGDSTGHETGGPAGWQSGDALDWVIVGGESGPGARNCSVDWIRAVVGQCQSAAVPVFVKQLGSAPLDWSKAEPTGKFRTDRDTGKRQFQITQPRLKDRKGGNPLEWPVDLMVREFPQ